MDADGLAAAINNLIAAHQPAQREMNLIKVETFDRTGDLISWLEQFEKAATANGWSAERKLAIMPAYLTGTAATWLQA